MTEIGEMREPNKENRENREDWENGENWKIRNSRQNWKTREIDEKYGKQAGAEMCQAQVKLELSMKLKLIYS